MAALFGVLFLGIAAILQTTIASRITLLQGSADLVLLTYLAWALREEVTGVWQWGLIAGLVVGLASELPIWLPIATYILVTTFIQLLKTHIWQVPVISLFTTTLLGTFLILSVQWLFVVFSGAPLDFGQAFNLVILPSMTLNLLLAFPIYGLMGEVTLRVYPIVEEL
jgi:hypothetical protein